MESSKRIEKAAEILACGGLVAFPTETVYGLGADASNPEAIAALYALKGRPTSHPSIVHLASTAQLQEWCLEVPDEAILLAAMFWPGPLTMVLKRAPGVLDAITGGQDTVAVRIPSHPVARKLLETFGRGIAAPSANRFGRISPTSAEDVRFEFNDEVMVLDGGQCQVGIESTIIDLSAGGARILRPGMIQEESIRVALSEMQTAASAELTTPRVPGDLPSHYAPKKTVQLVDSGRLTETLAKLLAEGKNAGVLVLSDVAADSSSELRVSMSCSPDVYAFALYKNLRSMDRSDRVDVIVIERPPSSPEWVAITDRLTRAAGERSIVNSEVCGDGT
ncbi:MAG: threonylcarbamoyl-AMP synthase [Candidatus Obscuribacterales bacterium]|nr:threonylcarbamoyl-AMP synthase [Candidatus Obscuribacterales bacterium]